MSVITAHWPWVLDTSSKSRGMALVAKVGACCLRTVECRQHAALLSIDRKLRVQLPVLIRPADTGQRCGPFFPLGHADDEPVDVANGLESSIGKTPSLGTLQLSPFAVAMLLDHFVKKKTRSALALLRLFSPSNGSLEGGGSDASLLPARSQSSDPG